MLVILAPQRLRQGIHCEFETRLCYIDPVSKKKKKRSVFKRDCFHESKKDGFKMAKLPVMVAHTCVPSPWEAESLKLQAWST